MTLVELEKRRDLLHKAACAKREVRDAEIAGAVEEIKAKYADELVDLNKRHVAAAEAVDDEKIRLALERGGDAPWPAGTKVVHRKCVSSGWLSTSTFEDEFGILEIRTRDTQFKAGSRVPEYGDTFVRFLKANGARGMRFEAPWRWSEWKAADPDAPKNPNYKDQRALEV